MNEKKWFDDALLINRDPNWYTDWDPDNRIIDSSSENHVRDSLRRYFESFTEYSITDLQLCIYENTSIVPSEVCMWRGNKYLQKEENGIAVSYPQLEGLYRVYREYNMDPVQIFLDVMKENNIRPWISLRMNDAHFNEDSTAFLRDDFFYEAEKQGWMIGKEYGYYSHCLDYSYEKVRTRMIDYIREVVGKYDMFGLELDFMREIYCFDYRNVPERHNIINDFMEEVKQILEEAGRSWGHSIRLMVRVHRSVEDSYEFGFDVGLWAAKGWVDAIVPSPRWECADDAIPVAQWKALVGNEIAVFPCIETLHRRDVDGEFTMTLPEMSRAYYAAWSTQGADGIYFFNHHFPDTWRDRGVYRMHRANLLEGMRRYIVTYQDIQSGSQESYRPLPLEVDTMATLSMNIGHVGASDPASLIVEFEGKNPPVITCNGIFTGEGVLCDPAQGVNEASSQKIVNLTGKHTYAYDCSHITTEGHMYVTFHGKGTVRYLEFRIGK